MSGTILFQEPSSKVRLQESLVEMYHLNQNKFYQTLQFKDVQLAFCDFVPFKPAPHVPLATSGPCAAVAPRKPGLCVPVVKEDSCVLESTATAHAAELHMWSRKVEFQLAPEMPVSGLGELLETSIVDKKLWPKIREWCIANDAREITDIKENLSLIAAFAKFPKLTAGRISRHAGW